MAQRSIANPLDSAKGFFGGIKDAKWLPWAIVALIIVALAIPLALALPAFLPKRQPMLQSIPSGAEQQSSNPGQPAVLPAVGNDTRDSIVSAAKDDGITIMDDKKVTVRYQSDTKHIVLGVPEGVGTSFRVLEYKFKQDADGTWSRSR